MLWEKRLTGHSSASRGHALETNLESVQAATPAGPTPDLLLPDRGDSVAEALDTGFPGQRPSLETPASGGGGGQPPWGPTTGATPPVGTPRRRTARLRTARWVVAVDLL